MVREARAAGYVARDNPRKNVIRGWLYGWILPRILQKKCDPVISRSGKKGEAVNCYVIEIFRAGSPFFLARCMDGNIVKGQEWDGASYSNEKVFSLADFAAESVTITHYYGLTEIIYDNAFDFLWNYLTRLVYLKVRLYRHIDSTHQYFFNKRKLFTKKRMDLLQFMMEDQLDRSHAGVCALDLLAKIYSYRMFLHPSREKQLDRLKLYLESLVSSGELDERNGEYVVTGKAIATLERYEEEERRHTEAVKLQRQLVLLTVLIVVLAAVQSGIVRLPTLIDFAVSSASSAPDLNQRIGTQYPGASISGRQDQGQ